MINRNAKLLSLVVVLLHATLALAFFSRPDVSLPRKDFAGFPRVIGDWTAVSDQSIDRQSMEILKVDDYMMREYRNSKGEIVNVYVGYFKSQREGKGIHSPRQCLPGAGWMPQETNVYQLPISARKPGKAEVNRFIMGKGANRMLYLFWYQGRGRIYADEYWNKVYLITDSITMRRTDGALVRMSNVITTNHEDALKTQLAFISQIMPLLPEYIPD